MKKLSLYMLALLTTAFVGCSEEDYDPSVGPQAYYPESVLAVSDVSVSTADAPTTVSLSDYIDEDGNIIKDSLLVGVVAVKEGAMPVNTIMEAEVEFSRDADFTEFAKIAAYKIGEEGRITVNPRLLQDTYFEDITKNPSKVTLYMRTVLYTVTDGSSKAIIGKPGDNYFDVHTLDFTPLNKVTIAPAYYIVGGPNDWAQSAANRTIKFQHSDEDVYIDPVFTVVFDASDGDTWFAIGDDLACDAIANGDWTQLYGIVGGDNEAKEGKLERRSKLGADNTFKVAAGAKKIRVTIDMMEGTFKVEAVSISANYYLIGGPLDWAASAASKEQKFSHSDKDVFDDPIFTYVLEGNGGSGDIWFAFGDDEACEAIGNGDWSQLFGHVGDMALSGSFDRRTVLGSDNSFNVDGRAKFYRITIDALNKTYEITPLNFQEYIYEAGVNNSWGDYQQPLYCADGNGTYTGYFYAQDADWTGGKGAFKFRGAADNWDNGNYGLGSFDEASLTGSLIDDGNSGNIMPAPGFYRADVNLADMTFKLTAINSVYVVGSAVGNDWDTGVAMTFNHDKHCWECDATFTEAGVIKFKGNGTWDSEDGNWGGTMDNIINGSNDNIPVTLSGDVHIEFYPLCDTKSYCTITAR